MSPLFISFPKYRELHSIDIIVETIPNSRLVYCALPFFLIQNTPGDENIFESVPFSFKKTSLPPAKKKKGDHEVSWYCTVSGKLAVMIFNVKSTVSYNGCRSF